jgi:acylphosphatase
MQREVHFRVTGRVQGVMFRQTLIRAAERRGIEAGASNLPDGSVSCFLSGAPERIDQILEGLQAGKDINSWGARVAALELLEPQRGIEFDEHQVTTANVGTFRWSRGVDMFL